MQPNTPPHLNPAPLALDTPAHAQLRLLMMVGARVSAELAGFIVPPVLIWMFPPERGRGPVVLWAVVYWVLSLTITLARRRFRRDAAALEPAQVLQRWSRAFHGAALCYGLTWGAVALLAVRTQSFELAILMYVVLAAVTASAVAFTAAVFGVFLRFFIGCWSVALVAVYWAFPDTWRWVLPLAAMYCFMIYRHAVATNRFLRDQVALEERSATLARRYLDARDEAQRALRAKSQFLATASHDLRQPVYALGLNVEAISLRNRDDSLAPLLQDLRSCARTINLMFESLIDLSKLEAGAFTPRPVPCRLQDVLLELHAQFKSDAAARGLDWRLRLPRQPAIVEADPTVLRRAISNLIHNALSYTPQGGVLLAARRRGDGWCIEVWDTGVGVADDAQQRIYSAFYRGQDAWALDGTGHGLGLAVFAECVKLMGGASGLRSRLNQGSRFWFTLPALLSSPQEVPVLAAASADGPLDAARRRRELAGRCLVVEDDPQLVSAWSQVLKAWNVEVRIAGNSAEALAHLEAGFLPQVVLCDYRLRSAESGFELLQTLLQRVPSARGAMVSGELEASELLRAEDEGYLVMRKPVEIDMLYALLQRWLSMPELSAPEPG